MSRCALIAVTCVGLLVGCEPATETPRADVAQEPAAPVQPEGGDAVALTVQSPAFDNNAEIPAKYTGDGEDVSPALSWSGVPEGAAELALVCDDPDAPRAEPWVHWVIYNIPAEASGLPENVTKAETLSAPAGAVQGTNSWGRIGYGGPAPPPGHGVHHYHFKLYALDAPLSLPPGADKDALLEAIAGHILAEGELIGTYQR